MQERKEPRFQPPPKATQRRSDGHADENSQFQMDSHQSLLDSTSVLPRISSSRWKP